MDRQLPPLSLYVHLPWCVRKCPYCDFNSHRAGKSAQFDRYVSALDADIEMEARRAPGRPIDSVFLGGGTPSLFSAASIGRILAAIRRSFTLRHDCEITMEANPGTVERGSLAEYRSAGVTRLSIGAQSFDAGMLRALGRIHGPDDIVATYAEACEAKFESINLDVMFALPGQDVDGAAADVEKLLSLAPPHVSYYQLTLEPNTVFHRQPPENMPDDDTAWAIQEQGQQMLRDAGYEQYEISAFAVAGHRCRHNLNYWQFGDYLAAGAGAHGKLTDASGATSRYRKPANPLQFMEQAERGEMLTSIASVPARDLAFEFMLNALRLSGGFSARLLRERTGIDSAYLGEPLGRAIADGLLEETDTGHWRPTGLGFRFLNDLQARFLP